ncbi:sorbosone dehydrogenase family protein [Halobacillus sp. A5]|uniref:PQQ-dependent sugar dehydrogenase n=1 Tax=Halobacillus sp. A5 TaxID=2880263 RepID=UPI0020A6CC88|nr:PQQ-dependent sugar dehydrogenase [Halobacillus sp. A5]MCP3027424.1 PQQ-dependent sugar dehydrogenase [Halobacillus sp. A5]
MRRFGWILIVLLAACQSPENEPQTQPEEEDQTQTSNEGFIEVASGLESPWDIEEDDGLIYISEREGTIARVSSDNQIQRQSLSTDKEITQIGEGGLLGLKLDPDFENNQTAFAYHTYEEEGEINNRVVQIRYDGEGWREERALLEDIPGSNFHNGGRIEIGPDENLYITTGDAQNEQLAQDEDNLAGKILRMDVEGNVPADNPFEDSYVYSYGHRNPQGMGWNEDGQLFATEHGPTNHDEVNQIEAGSNYGWPEIVGDEAKEGMETPLFQTGSDTWAPSGMVVVDDQIYAASLNGQALKRINLDGSNPENVTEEYGRLRDVEVIDGEIYFISNNTDGRGSPEDQDDQLIRLKP